MLYPIALIIAGLVFLDSEKMAGSR